MGYIPIVISSQIAGLLSDVAAMYSQLTVCICLYLHSKLDSAKKDFIDNLNQLASSYYDSIGNVYNVVKEVTYYADTIRTYGCAGRKLFLINGGKPLVKAANREGLNCRNQQLALDIAIRLSDFQQVEGGFMNRYDVVFVSIDTNGIDKSTNAAGALSYVNLVKDALIHSDLDATSFLRNNDSDSFFSKFQNGFCHISTADHTETEAMDIHFLMIGTK